MLCEKCKCIDFRSLIIACLQRYRDQQVVDGDGGLYRLNRTRTITTRNDLWTRHYENLHDPTDYGGSCNLCGVILEAVKRGSYRTLVRATSDGPAKALSIVLCPSQNCIEVLSISRFGLLYHDSLNMHMDSHEGELCSC